MIVISPDSIVPMSSSDSKMDEEMKERGPPSPLRRTRSNAGHSLPASQDLAASQVYTQGVPGFDISVTDDEHEPSDGEDLFDAMVCVENELKLLKQQMSELMAAFQLSRMQGK